MDPGSFLLILMAEYIINEYTPKQQIEEITIVRNSPFTLLLISKPAAIIPASEALIALNGTPMNRALRSLRTESIINPVTHISAASVAAAAPDEA